MNEDELKTSETVEKKPAKAAKTKVTAKKTEVAEEKKSKKKVSVKAKEKVEAEPKVKKTKTVSKAKEISPIEEIVKTAEPLVKKTRAKKATSKVSSAEDLKVETISSSDLSSSETKEKTVASETDVSTKEVELSPVFKELAEPKLPVLRKENRAYLQMQSPTRLFFYWSLKNDSYNTLQRALGNRSQDYFLAVRLINLTNDQAEVHRIDNQGSWWFNNIEADTKYRAEVGFYAHNHPFVRIVFSNTLETPRLKPSENTSYQPYFAVTANEFAEVLDLAGFSQDALDIYLAGDEPKLADTATQKAFVQLTGKNEVDFSDISLNELRYVLFALASGVSLFALRESVSPKLFEFLAALINANPEALTEEKVILALEEFFDFSPFEEELEEETLAPTVFGASLINFPKRLRRKKSGFNPSKKGLFPSDKISPLSSFSLK